MILGKHAIERAFDTVWSSDTDVQPGPNSVDVTLGPWLYNSAGEQVRSDGYKLERGKLMLGTTNESFNTDALFLGNYWVQMYEGRSTLGRCGLGTHVTAGFGDYGFKCEWTLELFVVGEPFVLEEGMRIGQVYFIPVLEPSMYEGAYSKGLITPMKENW